MSNSNNSAGDELLRWASEVGSGTWEQLRDASAHLGNKHKLSIRPWILAESLSVLGHLDIEWATRRWSIAPPALNLVPGLSLCIVLTGSRPYYIDRRFEDATDDLSVYPFPIEQPPAPAAKLALCASVSAAYEVGERFGAELVVNPARSLAESLVAIDKLPIAEFAPPPSLDAAEFFDAESLRWRPIDSERPGLYRIDLHGRPVHRRLDSHGNWYLVDLAVGQFLALEGRPDPAMRWQHGSNDGRVPPVLEVRATLALPVLAERAATVSSGLPCKMAGGGSSTSLMTSRS